MIYVGQYSYGSAVSLGYGRPRVSRTAKRGKRRSSRKFNGRSPCDQHGSRSAPTGIWGPAATSTLGYCLAEHGAAMRRVQVPASTVQGGIRIISVINATRNNLKDYFRKIRGGHTRSHPMTSFYLIDAGTDV